MGADNTRFVGRVVAAVALAAAAAGAGWWGWTAWQARTGAASAPAAIEAGTPEPFAFLECKARLFDGAPAIAVIFSQPLDRGQDFSRLVTATQGEAPAADKKPATAASGASAASTAMAPVRARWVLGDNPRVLYLPYATPQREYRIQLASGLASAAGAKLPADRSCSAVSEAMPESFYFASRGVVLPAGQNGGLPVVSVNVPEVDVEFLRVRPASLAAFLEQVGGRRERRTDSQGEDNDTDYYGGGNTRLKGRVEGYILDQLRELTDSVHIGRFTTDTRANRRNVSHLPVEKIKELQEPGIYVAVMRQPGRYGWDYQVTHFYVTDLGLHVRRNRDQIDAFVTSLKTGRAVSGIDLTLLGTDGKTLAQSRSDGEGHAVFTGRNEAARVLMARRGAKEAALLSLRDPALDLSEFDATGHPSRNNKLFLYAGRDLYRPGETFQVSALSRDADGRAPAQATPLTLTLKRPDGTSVVSQLVRPHATGSAYYQQTLVLPADAPTGTWMLQARLDPAAKQPDAQWPFQVEEFLPERMKLDLKAPPGPLQGSGAFTVQVQGDYLYGAPAAGNRLQATVYAERQPNPLAQKLPGFIFGDLADDKARVRQALGDETLDEQGRAALEVAPTLAERASPMLVRASVSLLESGGRPVVRSIERSWWPAPELLAVRPLFDRNVTQEGTLAEFEVTRVDGAGNFRPAAELKLRLVQEDRQWYWRYDDGRGWHSGYNVSEELVDARSLKLAARTKVAVPVRWGRYRLEIEDPATRQVLRYGFYAGWGAQDADDIGNRPDRVQLKLQGAPFQPGQPARLSIKPPHDGEALVTVEGDRVLYAKRVAVRAAGTDIEIPISADWKRHDLYITVAAFRAGSEGDRVTPARALGLVHLPLSREDRKIAMEVQAPAKTVPDSPLQVRVKAPRLAGKSAIVTVSAVDVGILNITRYKTPDPSDFFFGRHRYGADVLDFYGKLIEKMEGNTAALRFGGDAGKRDSRSLPRKVLLVDLFSGPVALDAKGEATLSLKLPDFNGTLRLMAVASNADSYGSAQAEVVVAAPLVAELAMPRFVAPGDKAVIALDLTNLSGAPQNATVQLESGGALKVSGNSTEAVKLADKQRKILRFTVEATDAIGLVPLKLSVNAGPLKLVREAALQVQPATPLVREVRRIRLEPDAVHKLDGAALDAYWSGSAALSVALSAQPPIDVREQVQGLLMYPYGCLEQTTSSAYPLVFIDEEAAKRFGLNPVSREERSKRLDGAFARLAGMQQPNGGFGLWSAASDYEAWLSAYVTGFLQDARAGGFNVPEAMFKRSLDSLLEQFQRAPGLQMPPVREPRRDAQGRPADRREVESLRQGHLRFAESAHVGYILAREQRAPLATLRTLHDMHRANARSPLPLVHLGLALKLMGDEARAKVALDDAMKAGYGIQPAGDEDWSEWLGDYGSRVRDVALAYALLHRHKVDHAQRENLLFDLAASSDFSRRQYLSTQERLALFLAVHAAQYNPAGADKGWKAAITQGTATAAASGNETQVQAITPVQLKRGASIRNTGTAPLYLEVVAQGYPLKPPAVTSEHIAIERALFTADGKPTAAREFTTGDMLIVRLRASARTRIKDGLIVDRIPAGFEVENLNLSQGPKAGEFTVEGVNIAEANANPRIVHKEWRDDRFVAAARLDGNRLEVYYLLRAVTPGRYVSPAPFAEDMYRPDLRGVGKGEADITVVDKQRVGS